jgi:hypothetical protein
MVKHLVFFRIKDENKAENAKAIKEKLESLKKKIPFILEFEIGLNEVPGERAWDISLASAFENMDDLNSYRVHPEHLKVVEFIAKYKTDSAAVDYTL